MFTEYKTILNVKKFILVFRLRDNFQQAMITVLLRMDTDKSGTGWFLGKIR